MSSPIRIDLRSSQGNANALIAMAKSLGRQCLYERSEIEALTARMREGSYEDLLRALEDEFPGLDFEFEHDPRCREPAEQMGGA